MANEYFGDSTRVFRHHLQPDTTEGLDVGTSARRFRTIRGATVTCDTCNATTVAATTVATTTVTATTLTGTGAADGFTGWNRSVSIDSNTSGSATAYTAAQSGLVTIHTGASGTRTFTLPRANVAGYLFTFVCAGAASEILVNPGNAADNFVIKANQATDSTAVTTAANTGIKNTAATNVVGDSITLVSDGVSTWHVIAQTGIWASQ